MAYSYYNPNPVGRYVEDCPVRALIVMNNVYRIYDGSLMLQPRNEV